MPPRTFLVDPSRYDLNNVIADIDEIRKYNAQRFEMEQLTAIVFQDLEEGVCVGYKDLAKDDFWTRGHMPGMPLMPGVLMCEAAAQLTSYYTQKNDLLPAEVIGFAGLDQVKFRGIVRPGDRFVIQAKLIRAKRRIVTAKFLCLVNDNLACEGVLKGTSLPRALLEGEPASPAE